MYIDIETLITAIYFIVNNWYLSEGHCYLDGKVGRKPIFTDSELLTLMIFNEFMTFKSERKFVGYIYANHLDMFPDMVDQSQFNRRSCSLRLILNQLREHIAQQLDVHLASLYVLDTAPVPVVGYKRNKKHSAFYNAQYGYCASKKLHYWGYKLVLLVTADGVPVSFELVPANTDERDAAEEVLPSANPNSIALGDKGFIDEERQAEWKNSYGVSVQTFKRKNQYVKNEPEVSELLKAHRSQIETTISSLERVEDIENTGAKTVLGLSTRVIVKITSYTFRHYLLRFYGIDVLNFQVVTIP
jgi:Transposase DDE domain